MDETSPPPPRPDDPGSRLEQQKTEALGALLDLAVKITRNDEKITGAVATIVDNLAQEIAKDPKAFFLNGSSDADALVAALKAKAAGGSGVSGGDIAGGLGWSDVVDTIKALEGFLKDEKQFVMEILRLIFCGCSGKGW
jgi:hypothetical protein